jgi:protocatechuate 3,4-dioxygenase beta subunit
MKILVNSAMFITLLLFTVVGFAQTGTFSGTVTDEAGLPIEDASVSLWSWGNWYCTETLEDGSFIIEDVEVGEYFASAFAWGYMWEDPVEVEILEGDTTVVDFVLESWWGGGGETGTCTGTVTDEDGQPIEGASVTLCSTSGWGWGWNFYSTFTLEDGSFIIEDVEVGEYSASAFAWGYMWEEPVEIEILEGDTTVVDFVLESWGGGGGATGTFAGTVTDEDGQPIEGASVSLNSTSGWGWWGWNSYTTFTLEDGSFIIEDVDVDEYYATAFAWGYMWEDPVEVEILENQTTTVDFVLESWGGGATGTCAGTVTDSAGTPIEGAFVSLHSNSGWGWGWWGWGGNCYFTETLEDGSFLIEDVVVDEYTATAWAWGYGWDCQDIEIFEGDTTVVNFVLEEWGMGGQGAGPEIVELRGIAMVQENARMTSYYIDTDGNNRPDYKLNFGPDWYYPPSGATRPDNGEFINIVGGLLEYGNPPMVIVYEINDLFWREPFNSDPSSMKRIRDRLHQPPVNQISKPKIVGLSSRPNPFNPETSISYQLTADAKVKIAIYNTLGQQVALLVDQDQSAGLYQFKWDASEYSSGFYFVNVNVNGNIYTYKLMLAK